MLIFLSKMRAFRWFLFYMTIIALACWLYQASLWFDLQIYVPRDLRFAGINGCFLWKFQSWWGCGI